MTMRMIDSTIVEKIKDKYGMPKLRAAMQLYGAGIPEQYWFDNTPPLPHMELFESKCIESIAAGKHICVVGDNITVVNQILVSVSKKLMSDKKLGTRYSDYVMIMKGLIDKYGLMQLNVLDQWNDFDVIAISNIRNYGYQFKKIQPIFLSVIDSLLNSVFRKTIILGMEIKPDKVDTVEIGYEPDEDGNLPVREGNGDWTIEKGLQAQFTDWA